MLHAQIMRGFASQTLLGWEPKITLEEMVKEMIKFDSLEAEKEIILKNKGYEVVNSVESIPSDVNQK